MELLSIENLKSPMVNYCMLIPLTYTYMYTQTHTNISTLSSVPTKIAYCSLLSFPRFAFSDKNNTCTCTTYQFL